MLKDLTSYNANVDDIIYVKARSLNSFGTHFIHESRMGFRIISCNRDCQQPYCIESIDYGTKTSGYVCNFINNKPHWHVNLHTLDKFKFKTTKYIFNRFSHLD